MPRPRQLRDIPRRCMTASNPRGICRARRGAAGRLRRARVCGRNLRPPQPTRQRVRRMGCGTPNGPARKRDRPRDDASRDGVRRQPFTMDFPKNENPVNPCGPPTYGILASSVQPPYTLSSPTVQGTVPPAIFLLPLRECIWKKDKIVRIDYLPALDKSPYKLKSHYRSFLQIQTLRGRRTNGPLAAGPPIVYWD